MTEMQAFNRYSSAPEVTCVCTSLPEWMAVSLECKDLIQWMHIHVEPRGMDPSQRCSG